jgi:uncharacterized lipoprotein YddW (UPF0748 family)
MMQKCVEYETDIVVIDVKPISGYVLYNSKIAPKMTEWKGETHPEDYDLLQVCIEEGHKRGLKVYASMNFFSEGHLGGGEAVPKHGLVLDDPKVAAWQSMDYVVLEGDTEPSIIPAQEGVRGYAIFVSAAHPEVVDYEMALLKEICQYDIDGVCLDRVRFSGITADFSPAARASFEKYLGKPVADWPADIYRYERKPGAKDVVTGDEGARKAKKASEDYERVPGPLYNDWLTWRTVLVRDIIEQSRALVKGIDEDIVFADYTGAWYPEYFEVGVNWASKTYDPSKDLDWAPADYQKGAYAEMLDLLYSGWYYTHVTEEQALAGDTYWWASMEGTAKLLEPIINDAVPVHGSLYLFQYENNPERFRECMRAVYDLSDGLMLFDLVYLEQYGWWEEIRKTFPERFEQ